MVLGFRCSWLVLNGTTLKPGQLGNFRSNIWSPGVTSKCYMAPEMLRGLRRRRNKPNLTGRRNESLAFLASLTIQWSENQSPAEQNMGGSKSSSILGHETQRCFKCSLESYVKSWALSLGVGNKVLFPSQSIGLEKAETDCNPHGPLF